MDGSVMYRGRGALGMAVVVLFAIVLRCGAFSRVPDRFRGALEELGVPPGGVSWPTKPPESPPMVLQCYKQLNIHKTKPGVLVEPQL